LEPLLLVTSSRAPSVLKEWYVVLLLWVCFFHFLLQDKILQSGGMNESIQVTNDGATILKSIGVDNPAAKVLIGKNTVCLKRWMECILFIHFI
jgi:hypothetical protein